MSYLGLPDDDSDMNPPEELAVPLLAEPEPGAAAAREAVEEPAAADREEPAAADREADGEPVAGDFADDHDDQLPAGMMSCQCLCV